MLSWMQGVTTAILAFMFVCIVFPSLVKVRAQWYAALVGVLLIILLDAVGRMVEGSPSARVVLYVFTAILQVGAIGLLILACGGLTARELGEDMKRAYAVIRRGEEETEILIPRGDRMAQDPEDAPRTVYVVDDPPPDAQDAHGSLPVEEEATGDDAERAGEHPPEKGF